MKEKENLIKSVPKSAENELFYEKNLLWACPYICK